MSEKIIKGQAWIDGKRLVQDTTTFTSDYNCISSVSVILENIWDDLLSSSGTYKSGKDGVFYWEYEMTSMEDDDTTVKAMIGCPSPAANLFEYPYDEESVSGDYAKYWIKRMKFAHENMEKASCIQRKEVVLRGTSYLDQNGNVVTIDDMVVSNNDLGDITSLLNLF